MVAAKALHFLQPNFLLFLFFQAGLGIEGALDFLLNLSYDGKEHRLEVKQRVSADFLLTALNRAPLSQLVQFYERYIDRILQNLIRDHSVGSDTARKDALVAKSTSCQLIGELQKCLFIRAHCTHELRA